MTALAGAIENAVAKIVINQVHAVEEEDPPPPLLLLTVHLKTALNQEEQNLNQWQVGAGVEVEEPPLLLRMRSLLKKKLKKKWCWKIV